jgi:ParB-like chromosome segregation protein Spo0J
LVSNVRRDLSSGYTVPSESTQFPNSSTTQATIATRMRVAELRPSDRNPRTISASRFENLKRSLREDPGFLHARPLLVNSYPGRNFVVAGNMRLRAAQDLGWDEVPVLVVSVPPEIEAQWNLKDNN